MEVIMERFAGNTMAGRMAQAALFMARRGKGRNLQLMPVDWRCCRQSNRQPVRQVGKPTESSDWATGQVLTGSRRKPKG